MSNANTLGRKRVSLPIGNDIDAIDAFLALHPGKKVVVIQGLGFVGAVMSLVVANALTEEYAVIGVDILSESSYWKIDSINRGQFPIKADDPKIEQFFQKARDKRNLYATFDSYAYSKADVIIVDINLDVKKHASEINELEGYEVNLDSFRSAMETIGRHCKPDCLVLVETTVPPGTCRHIVRPIIEDGLRSRSLATDAIKIGHSYERVMPGPNYIDSIQNFYRVFSGVDEKSKRATEGFLRTVISTKEFPLTELGSTNATEMAKVLENSYRAMNIGFMVEWSRFAEEAEVDLFEVVKAIRMRPTHKNIMLPGIGVGGYCLTKDPLLASWSKQNLFGSKEGLKQSENGVRTNDLMPYYAYQQMKKHFGRPLSGAKVLLLGVSYLNDVGDTRYTPVEILHGCLTADGADVICHDPFIEYWDEKRLEISQDLDAVMKSQYDAIVVSTGHSLYKDNAKLRQAICENRCGMLLFDTIGIFGSKEIAELQQSVQVKVLGRGDL